MSAVVAPQTGVGEQDPITRTVEDLFRFSMWVHVGPDAENCSDVDEQKGEVNCGNPHHWHAWLTLPNQFQHREIHKTAMAAKARRARQMRTEGSDSFEILEEELDYLLRRGDDSRGPLIDEILSKDWWRDYLEATRDVRELEGDDGKLYEGIDQDRRRLAELEDLPEGERPEEEYAELQSHVAGFFAKVQETAEAIVSPKREALQERPIPELVDMVRADRIDRESNEEFTHSYNENSWFVGVRRTPGAAGERLYETLDDMRKAPPEVIAAIEMAFGEMEKTRREVESGNS